MMRYRTAPDRSSLHLCCGLLLAAALGGCKSTERHDGKDTSGTSSTARGASATADTMAMATRPTRPTNPCSFTIGAVDACKGLFQSTALTWKDLQTSEPYLLPKLESDRFPDQHGLTFVNQDGRKIDLDRLPVGQSLLMGAIRFEGGKGKDPFYKVGSGLPPTDAGRMVYFVVNRPIVLPGSPTFGTTVAQWNMYGVDVPHKQVKLIAGPGNIVECTEESTVNNDKGNPNSYFTACKPVHIADSLARALKLPFNAVLAYAACKPDESGTCTKTQANAPHGFNVMSVDQRKVLLAAIPKIFGDPLTAPYWFSCGQGCCTAEML